MVEGVPKAVNVKSVEPHLKLTRKRFVVFAKPLGQLDHFFVRPHPGRPAVERVQHLTRVGTGISLTLDVAVDAIAIGPIPFDGDQ